MVSFGKISLKYSRNAEGLAQESTKDTKAMIYKNYGKSWIPEIRISSNFGDPEPVGQDTRTGSQDLQDPLGGTGGLPEAASDHHKTFSQDPSSGHFRDVPAHSETSIRPSETIAKLLKS